MAKFLNIIGITLFFILGLFSFGFCEESITITTYYPSPYGSYKQLSVTESGAQTAADIGLNLTNTATSSTASINKYGMYISSTGTWNGASANNYGLYIDTPTGGTNNYGLIVAGGNVGIGTAGPGELLTIGGENGTSSTDRKTFRINSGGYSSPGAFNTASNGDKIILYDSAAASYDGRIGVGSTSNFWFKSYGSTDVGDFEFYTGRNATPRLTIKGTGNVGIGTTSPTLGPLQMGSGAYVTTGGVWTDASSRAYKQDIAPLALNKALKTLTGLKPVTFRYKRAPDERHVGFISEDVPELVATKDRTGLSSMDIVAVLTKVVQQQQKEIEGLKAEIHSLKRKL